ncbi:MAG TPA: ester cyclase [Albidovulum sp.]|uniref:ester cyclase n=1 Tax=Albidovulum sp. TaxID=1872424 RepID=UPI001DF1C663|nr:ester cyclase [Paracoccaceae bacterium]MCC0046354.1 ester cyclase [Defluviimonas sp.]HRV63074.1 ester cyclase [Albidovulum sp.]MCB2144203.1 ester cyclase [Paracoccaceae bacterium]MCO5128059.1 ester cyclase [Paracoccaceae bacterium]
MSKLKLLQDWYRQVWIEADLDAVDRYFSPRTGADGLMPDGQVGPEDFKALVPALLALVRNLDIRIDRSIEAGDWLWAQISVHAVTAEGMAPICAAGQVMMRIEGDRITEAYNAFDFLTFFQQAGLLPEDAFLLLLSGERLG